MKELLLDDLRYVVRYPEGFSEEKRYPVILLLHGAGIRGDDISLVKTCTFFRITGQYENFPFVCVAPLCTENTWFDLWGSLKKLVQVIANAPYADPSRIYLMGASMGGYATWQLAMSMPEYFAAIVPICGGGMYWNAGRLLNVPVWAFHGAKDKTVLVEESVKMVEAAKKRGADATLTIYPENTHDAWSDTYSNPEVFSWLLQHQCKTSRQYIDQYNNPEIYG